MDVHPAAASATAQSSLIIVRKLLDALPAFGPRYTSYPTADRFADAFPAVDYEELLREFIKHTPAAIAISLIGFASALKGGLLMIAPTLGSAMSVIVVQTLPILVIAIVLEFALGLWLSYVGWFQK